ncbi:MAG TPA: NAD(P)-binding protein [Pseudonocardiaceae bacterium]|nr:NAD(P)-binding protein [Pseudonocardiaceae bacterium]
MNEAPRVVVIGGGLGGLCLAEGLHRAGIPVTVHERDAGPAARRQGYRIHLGGVGATALADCLPPASYQLLLATASHSGGAGHRHLRQDAARRRDAGTAAR